METEFTPVASALGGALIGLAAVALMALRGRIMGATGILAGTLVPSGAADWLWRALVVAGMLTGPWVYLALTGGFPEITVPAGTPALAVGGLIVGAGVTLGSGCTSGHGVCGLARLSVRSFVAVPTFMATTAATVYLVRHVFGG